MDDCNAVFGIATGRKAVCLALTVGRVPCDKGAWWVATAKTPKEMSEW